MTAPHSTQYRPVPNPQHELERLADLILRIEAQMRRSGLWANRVPPPAAMASREPFCVDTLAFSEWLQFIFLPRMHEIIEADDALPRSSGIAAMAEEALAGQALDRERLICLLREFDRIIGD